MDNPVMYYILLVGISVLGIFQNSVVLSPLRFHCNNYIFNTYLYFILSWGIVLSTVTAIQYKNIPLKDIFTKPFTILLFVSSILLLLGIMSMKSSKHFISKHIMFIFLLMLFGVTMYPYYVYNKNRFNHIGLTTLGLFLILSLIAYINPGLISSTWKMYLTIALLALLLARVVEMFMIDKTIKSSKYSRIITYISISVFALFTMFDTKQVIINASECRASPYGPDYINESMNLFLDSMNMFQNIYTLQSD